MLEVIEFQRLGRHDLFRDEEDRLVWMRLSDRLARRWSLSRLAFRLGAGWASFLVEGDRTALGHWARLLQSSYGVWRYSQGADMAWRELSRTSLPPTSSATGARLAYELACLLHRHGGGDPLRYTWSSLRDGVGLREAPWFDASWLSQFEASRLYQDSGGREQLPSVSLGWSVTSSPSWERLSSSVAQSTGQRVMARRDRTKLTHLAARAGWSPARIAIRLENRQSSVRRCLQKSPPNLRRALLHLTDERLQQLPGERVSDLPPWSHYSWLTEKGFDVMSEAC